MNKKDIATFRQQFKLDNELLEIDTIFNVYVQKESGTVYHHESQSFGLLEKEAQELFLVNFRKVLTGQLGTKVFELTFRDQVEDSTQTTLYDGLHTENVDDFQDYMLDIVDKMFSSQVYDFDTVVTFITGQYRKPVKKRSQASGEGGNDSVYGSRFILCSLNKTTQPISSLVFDYVEKTFKPNAGIDPIINLTAPLTGFLFPALVDNAVDVNRLIYNSGKPNYLNETFIHDVLNCEYITTAAEDKDTFGLIVNELAGEQVNADLVSNIYNELDRRVQESVDEDDEEDPIVNYRDVKQILTTSGIEDVETEDVKAAFKTVIDDEQHAFKASQLIPRSVRINTEVAKMTVKPENLDHVRYITHNGRRYLLVEIEEDVEIEGFQLESSPFD